MPEFFCSCPKGLSSALEKELTHLGLKKTRSVNSGVLFEDSWAKAYEVNLKSKVASRVLKPVLDFSCSTPESISSSIKKHDFSKYLKKNGTFSIKVKLRKSTFRDQIQIMNLARKGLMELFQEKGREDIGPGPKNPDLEIVIQVYGVNFSVALNMSGKALSQRGYRTENPIVTAPIRENLAAGLIYETGWPGTGAPLIDLFCGTGTFLLEAALIKKPNQGPFAFQKWANFDEAKFAELEEHKTPKLLRKKTTQGEHLLGFEQHPRLVQQFQNSITMLGLQNNVQVKQLALKDIASKHVPSEKGIVILNPPYGERLGSRAESIELFKQLGDTLKVAFQGWKVYLLSPSPEHSKALRMASDSKIMVDNGGLDCAFISYEIRA